MVSYLIGTNRKNAQKAIGFRSIALLMLGSFIFTYVSTQIGGDPTRIIAQIVTGTGFLSAGLIFKESKNQVRNLTTAILVWCLSAIGVLFGLKMIVEAIFLSFIILIILSIKHNEN